MKQFFDRITTITLVMSALFFSPYSFGQNQIDFKEITLSIIQSIAFTSTYNDMTTLEESKKLEIKRYKNEDRTETLYFTIAEKEIRLRYSADKKLIYANTTFEYYTRTVFDKLEETGFKRTDEPITQDNVFGPTI